MRQPIRRQIRSRSHAHRPQLGTLSPASHPWHGTLHLAPAIARTLSHSRSWYSIGLTGSRAPNRGTNGCGADVRTMPRHTGPRYAGGYSPTLSRRYHTRLSIYSWSANPHAGRSRGGEGMVDAGCGIASCSYVFHIDNFSSAIHCGKYFLDRRILFRYDYQDFILLREQIMVMQPHQERVLAEKSELDAKIEKLDAFRHGDIYHTLSVAERDRLTRQYAHIKDYSNVLGERIAAF